MATGPDLSVKSISEMEASGNALIAESVQLGDRMHNLMKTINGMGWDSTGQEAFLNITVKFDRANQDLQRMLGELGHGVKKVAKRTEETEAGIKSAWDGGFGPSGNP